MTDDLSRDRIDRAVRAIDSDWRVLEADPAEGGYLPVYRLAVGTPSGRRDCYLKAAPGDEDAGVDLDARLLSILDAHTAVPVPEVYGAVEPGGVDDDRVPAPCFLAAAADGRVVERSDLGSLAPEIHERVARSVGRQVAALGEFDAVDAYGYLRVDDSPLGGERPPADPETIAVRDPVEDWRDRLRTDAEAELAGARESRFGDLAGRVEPVLYDRIDRVEGPFSPTLCRVDWSIENLAFDSSGEDSTGAVTAAFDWAFTVAAPADYDLLYAARSLSGGLWRLVPGFEDRRDRVREAVVEGYLSGGGSRAVVDRFRANRETYRLLALVRAATLFEDWFDLQGVAGDRREAAAETLRTAVESLV